MSDSKVKGKAEKAYSITPKCEMILEMVDKMTSSFAHGQNPEG